MGVISPSRLPSPRNRLGKRLPYQGDDNDACDSELRLYSNQYEEQHVQQAYTRYPRLTTSPHPLPAAISSISRSVARASPRALWSPPGSFWLR